MKTTRQNKKFTQHHFCMGCKSGAGFSTLELLMAFVVLTLSLTAVIMLVFGNQSMAIDTELAQRGTYLAERHLEEAGITAQTNFGDLISTSTSAAPGESFNTSLDVIPISECAKKVTSHTFWERGLRNLSTSLSSIFTSTEMSAAVGGDCDTVAPTSDWDTPNTLDDVDLSPSGNKGTDLDIVNRPDLDKTLVIVSSMHGAVGSSDIWIYDVTDPSNIQKISDRNVGESIISLDGQGDYVFALQNTDSNQLNVIDTSDPTNPSVATTTSLPGVSGTCPNYCPEGRSVYFYDNHVYIGTHRVAGEEFHVYSFDPTLSPLNPNYLKHVGSKEINHNVNDIVVQDDLAYLATSDNEGELIILDVSNPSNIPDFDDTRTDGGLIPGTQDGTKLFASAPYVFLGREGSASEDDLFVLDTTSIENIKLLGSADINVGSTKQIVGVEVRGQLIFLATSEPTAGFQVWKTTPDYTSIELLSPCSEYNYSEQATSFDFWDNFGFVSNESNNALRVIYDTPDVCPAP